MARIEVFIDRDRKEERLGVIRLEPTDSRAEPIPFTTPAGESALIDLSKAPSRFRGPKYAWVKLPGMYPLEVAISRKTGVGFQTLPNGSRLGVAVEQPGRFFKKPQSVNI